MPRGRMLNKKISSDEKIAKLSLKATLFYTWCVPNLDFEGRLMADVWSLKSIFPFISEVTPKNIPRLIKELITADLVTYYGNSRHKYLQFKGFKKNQNLKEGREADSIIPPPTPEQLLSNSCITPDELPSKIREDKIREDKIRDTPLFWDYFLLKTQKKFILTDDRKTLIRRRLETHSLADLKKAVDNFMADDWGGRADHLDLIYCIGKQKGKPDNLEKWINITKKNERGEKLRPGTKIPEKYFNKE